MQTDESLDFCENILTIGVLWSKITMRVSIEQLTLTYTDGIGGDYSALINGKCGRCAMYQKNNRQGRGQKFS